MNRRHLEALTTDIGIWQHAKGGRPAPDHGYCTDDAARALTVDLLHQHQLGWEAVRPSAARNVRFLDEAFDAQVGWFRNLRDSHGRWLAAPVSEDASARAIQALGETVRSAPSGDVRTEAAALFERTLPSVSRVRALRPMATVLLACDAAVHAGMAGEVLDIYARVGENLQLAFDGTATSADWPWPESVVTYENELPARALIVGGHELDRPRMTDVGLHVLDWLIEAQTTPEGYLSTIGNAGWWPKGDQKAVFDQQPISATALLLAAETASEVTRSTRYHDAMEMAYGWFLGRNVAGAPVAEPASGACHDGIGPQGVNLNQGAESTLMWLTALERIRALRERTTGPLDAWARAGIQGDPPGG